MSRAAYQPLGETRRAHDARARLIDVLVELVAEHGLRAANVGRLTEAAGLDRRTFYRYFSDVSAAFVAASFELHADLRSVVDREYLMHATARERAVACVDALVAHLREDRARAEVLFVQAAACGVAIDPLRAETKDWAIGLVTGAPRALSPFAVPARHASPDTETHQLLAEMAVGGVHGVIWRQLVAGDLDGLEDAKPGFVETLLWPHRWSRRAAATAPGS
jgi:AcrR family transcriptional regulator